MRLALKTISGKAVALIVVMSVVTVAATTGFLLNHFSRLLGTDRLLQNVAAAEMIINPEHQPYSLKDGKLLIGSRVMNGDEKSVDAISSAFGGVATVFMGDTRVATTVKTSEGARAVGTKLARGHVYDTVLRDGKDYIGAANILGKDYVTVYRPMRDESGSIIGILFVGFDKHAFNAQMINAAETAALAGIILALVCAVTGGWFFLRLFAPFKPLARLMEEARHGKYADQVPYTEREDEFGELARVIETFYRSAQERRQQRAANIELVNASFGETLAALARRDLTCRLSKEIPAEYSALRENLNNATAELDSAMADIDERAKDIATGAAEINKAAQEMSDRTQREAASLEQTSAAVNQLTAAVRKSAEGATQANDAAAAAKLKAEQGSVVVKDAVGAIREIAHSSSEITQIIGVINDIAFQTNLLALNAGVEAARAGDAGKGFAVVASEVRSLAQRSAEAAKQIKQLISSSEGQVENGVRLVEESGGAFDKIVSEIATIYDLVAAISASQKEQAVALGEIDTAVQHLDHATQQNAAMAEQSCAASDGLAVYARELKARVSQFHVSEKGRAPQSRTLAA